MLFHCTYRHSVGVFPADLIALSTSLLERMIFLEQELHFRTIIRFLLTSLIYYAFCFMIDYGLQIVRLLSVFEPV